ncbi:MAG: DUF2214 family protein [Caulobacterales bacterium]
MPSELLDAALSTAHFIAVLIIAGALATQAFLLRAPLSKSSLLVLARSDLFYGLAAVALIIFGASRVEFGLRGHDFYFASHAFWGKIAVFTIIGLLSIQPTMKFRAWRKAARADEHFAPPEIDVKSVRRFVMIEVHLLALVVIFAALMARGIG